LIVLDASLISAWLLGEPSVAADTALDTYLQDIPIAVPSHWPVEVSNVLRTHLQAGRLSIVDFHGIIDRLDLLTVRIQPAIDLDEIGPLAQFATAHELTAYDASYVQLALQNGAPLATLDRAMRAAATRLNIVLLPTSVS
jgi:predicted nucleic acid-binding protein